MKIKLLENENFDRSNTKEKMKQSSDEDINNKYEKGEIRIITEQARYPLHTLKQLFKENYKIDPEYQRRYVWDNKKKSRLVESFIMNVPVPAIFLYEVDYAEYEVMDGKQRISTIMDFYEDKFSLEGLDVWKELNKKKYSELPEKVKEGINRRYLSSIILLKESAQDNTTAEQLKKVVFERLNTGGVTLKPQEIRNALYSGKMNDLCKKLSDDTYFKKLWLIESNPKIQKELYKNMFNEELVLRFFAFRHIDTYSESNLSLFLDNFLKNANNYDDSILEEYKKIFRDTMKTIYTLFGDKSFKIYKEKKDCGFHWIKKPIGTIYDFIVIYMQAIDNENIDTSDMKQNIKLLEEFYKTNKDKFSGQMRGKNKIQERVGLFHNFFIENFKISR